MKAEIGLGRVDGRRTVESVRAERDQQLDLDRLFHPWETRGLRALIGMHEARTGAMAAAIEHEERGGGQDCQAAAGGGPRALRALIGMHEARTGAMAAAIEHEERVGRQYCQVCGVAVTRGSLLCRAHYPRRVAGLESSEKQKFEKQKAKI